MSAVTFLVCEGKKEEKSQPRNGMLNGEDDDDDDDDEPAS